MNEKMDLKKFIYILKRRFFTIFLTTICLFALSALSTIYIIKPIYETTEYILVGKLKKDDSTYSSVQDINMLLASSIDIIKSPIVLHSAADELSVKPEELAEMVTVQNNKDSQIINIVVRDDDSDFSQIVSHTIAKTAVDKMKNSLNVDDIQVLNRSEKDILSKRIGSPELNMAIGFAVGLFIGIGLAMLKEYLANTVSDPNVIEFDMGIQVLGAISLSDKSKFHSRRDKSLKSDSTEKGKRGGEIHV
ncbi:Wzz/FepE/Etk N-terminal domain-containing protein [Metabacillus idriensis]|uniref:Polysaccharide chain length determinant N-terminal domain-containing protein n=1 Tax=Metabacillus idriensis TaxID=324768 RepID=A0A6I2M9L7_9BACI|nr:Wzz/FepE/Etk N-terminal domain-containing protein [Metabacillus idriensis]MCM3598323.1 Wzz/FepE/Etk N-terminal domain-containing protein [Metabacillus idriensis]MRX55055.1 hypothetical protein [Metabacillus idriensis]OHR71598.1 hypothetical protein HMPREF3291_23910 [Bacillus sp. HMSC76G11]